MKILAEQTDGTIEVLEPQAFALEVRLQELLEAHPSLVLADVAEDPDRHIWTIGWEVSTDAGSIDLLMLDSTGVVWVVETKLASNSEIKKQVVGQVLGYASCAVEWDAQDLQRIGDDYLQRRLKGSKTMLSLLSEDLGDEAVAEELISLAADRLTHGDVTALIVVDDIPRELRRLVEFVNVHASFELLALKIEVVSAAERRFFIPTVVGSTATRERTRTDRLSRDWDADSFFAELETTAPDSLKPAQAIHEWIESDPSIEVSYGTGAKTGSMIAWAHTDRTTQDWIQLFTMWTSGKITGGWTMRVPHKGSTWWQSYVDYFANLSGIPQSLDRARAIPLSTLGASESIDRLKAATEALLTRTKTANNA